MRPPGRAVRADSRRFGSPRVTSRQCNDPGHPEAPNEQEAIQQEQGRAVEERALPARRGPGERHAQPVSAQEQDSPDSVQDGHVRRRASREQPDPERPGEHGEVMGLAHGREEWHRGRVEGEQEEPTALISPRVLELYRVGWVPEVLG